MPKISGSTSLKRLPVRKSISLFEAALPLIAMLACLVGSRLFFPASTDLLVAVMLIAAVVAGLIAVRHGYGWADIERSTA